MGRIFSSSAEISAKAHVPFTCNAQEETHGDNDGFPLESIPLENGHVRTTKITSFPFQYITGSVGGQEQAITPDRREEGKRDGRQRILEAIRRKSPRAVRGDSVGNFGASRSCLDLWLKEEGLYKGSNGYSQSIQLRTQSGGGASAEGRKGAGGQEFEPCLKIRFIASRHSLHSERSHASSQPLQA